MSDKCLAILGLWRFTFKQLGKGYTAKAAVQTRIHGSCMSFLSHKFRVSETRQHHSNGYPTDHPYHKHLPTSHPSPQTSLLISDDFKAYLPCDSECLRKLYLTYYPISLSTTGLTSYPWKSQPRSRDPRGYTSQQRHTLLSEMQGLHGKPVPEPLRALTLSGSFCHIYLYIKHGSAWVVNG